MSPPSARAGNQAASWGGGLFLANRASLVVQASNCSFAANKAGVGGGLFLDTSARLDLWGPGAGSAYTGAGRCEFSGNQASGRSGGAHVQGGATVVVQAGAEASWVGNVAGTAGGGMSVMARSSLAVNGSALFQGAADADGLRSSIRVPRDSNPRAVPRCGTSLL